MRNVFTLITIVLMGAIFYGLTVRAYLGNFTQVSQLETIRASAQPFESSHERSSYAEMLNLRQNDSIELPQGLRDFAAADVGVVKGKYYSYFPPGIALYIRPFYELGYPHQISLLLAFASISLLGILCMVLIYLIAKDTFNMPGLYGFVAAMVFAFGSTSWSYAVTIYQHIPGAFFALLMFYGVSRYRARGASSALWASIVWLTYGISIFFDYPNGILLAPFIVYYIMSALEITRREHTVSFKTNMAHWAVIIWFMIAVAAHMTYNTVYLNNWHAIRQTFERYDPNYTNQVVTQQAELKIKTVTTENIDQKVEERFHIPFVEELFVSGLYTLMLASDKGLLFYSPIFLFAFYGLYIAFTKKHEQAHRILASFIILNIFLYASFPDPYGGWAFGPRYLIPSMGLLALYAAYGLYNIKSHVARVIFYILYLISMSIAAAGALTTNNIPPRVEAMHLKSHYFNYLLNFHMLDLNKSSSFVYGTYLKSHMSLSDMYILIVLSQAAIMYVVLFVIPLLNRRKK